MPTKPSGNGRYDQQRARKTPPHMSLANVRAVSGLTLDQVIARIAEDAPQVAPTRGALSAVETGTRGASPALLDALCVAYGVPPGSLVTDYEPRSRVEAVA